MRNSRSLPAIIRFATALPAVITAFFIFATPAAANPYVHSPHSLVHTHPAETPTTTYAPYQLPQCIDVPIVGPVCLPVL